MGIKFVGNALVETFTWTVLSWENIREMVLDKQVSSIIYRKDKDSLKGVLREIAKDIGIADVAGLERVIDDLADDIIYASGDVVVSDSYEHLDALMDLMEEFIGRYC